MSSFISNQAYEIVSETELASVLSHYSTEFVISVVEDAMKKRNTELPIIQIPNVVSAWEANFKMIMEEYQDLPQTKEEVLRVRAMTYMEIIEAICKEFNLQFTTDENIDLFSAAMNLYSFFVCGFAPSMINFFSMFIYRERNSIYESMNLAELKKNKDSSTIYGKKIFKDLKLAVINANIDLVIRNIAILDITLDQIFDTIADSNVSSYMKAIVSDKGSFYQDQYVNIINGFLRAEYLTSIRLSLQIMSGDYPQLA